MTTPSLPPRETAPYYVVGSGSRATVFVKEGVYFRSQGGLCEPWGKNWVGVDAASFGEARRIGAKMFGITLSHLYWGEK